MKHIQHLLPMKQITVCAVLAMLAFLLVMATFGNTYAQDMLSGVAVVGGLLFLLFMAGAIGSVR